MRIAAALILTLASSVALAEQPYAGFVATDSPDNETVYRGSFQVIDRDDRARQPQQQPYSGLLGQTEGNDWRNSPAPDSNGFIYDQYYWGYSSKSSSTEGRAQ